MSFERLDHTADTGLDLWAATLPALFEEAARGFTDTVADPAQLVPAVTHLVEAEAGRLDELLLAWLEELVYLYDRDGFLAAQSRVTVDEAGGSWRLRAHARGEVHDPERHPHRVLIKGVTYHQLAVEPAGDGWRGRVIFDI